MAAGLSICYLPGLPQKYQGATTENLDNRLLPGLINSHTHAAMTLMRGIADDLHSMDWLQTISGRWNKNDERGVCQRRH
jgi:cytosine/adenosine deaminase-related metal-dependent hydrolase